MKKIYETMDIEILRMEEDIVRTSDPFSPKPGENELPYLPFIEG